MKCKVFILLFLLLFLTGCGTPSSAYIASMGLFGTYTVFLISILTFFIFAYFTKRRPKNFSREFIKTNKLLLWVFLAVFIVNFLVIVQFGSSESDYIISGFLMITVIDLVVALIPTAIYTISLLILFRKIKILEKYSFLVPIIITIFYIMTLTYVVYHGQGEDWFRTLLIIWIWPLYLLELFAQSR